MKCSSCRGRTGRRCWRGWTLLSRFLSAREAGPDGGLFAVYDVRARLTSCGGAPALLPRGLSGGAVIMSAALARMFVALPPGDGTPERELIPVPEQAGARTVIESVTPPGEPERWLPVVGYEGLYEVSDLGRVRSLSRVVSRSGPRGPRVRIAGQALKVRPPAGTDPYAHVELNRDGERRYMRVHVLVAAAFLGPRPAGYEICHGPGGKTDNRLANLSYGTRAKNNGPDKLRDGTARFGTRNLQAKLTDEIVRECRDRVAAGESRRALAREFGVSPTAMEYAVRGIKWSQAPGQASAEPAFKVKLTDEIVRDCRERYASGETFRSIADRYSVSRATVQDAVNGRTWKHVPFPGTAEPPAA